MKMNKKGFTLIEMLVVIAIIAVLVSIVIPVVGSATEKAKEAADAANIRAAIAEVTTTALMDGATAANALDAKVPMTQGTAGFVTAELNTNGIGGLTADQVTTIAGAVKGQTVEITWDATANNNLGAIVVNVTGTAAN